MTPGAMLDWDSEAFLLAAPDRSALADRVGQLRDRLEGGNVPRLKDLAFTLNTDHPGLTGRSRLGIVASSNEELIQRLRAIEPRLRDPSCRQVHDARGLYFWEEPLGAAGSLAFLFPGEGSQYPGMLTDLCPHFPEIRAVFDTADRIALESGEEVSPSRHLFAPADPASEALWATDTAVTTVLASQWALFQVLTRLGLHPDAVAGHSSGELQALAATGVISTEVAHERQLARLSAIFRRLESTGAIPSARLVAAGTDRARVEATCREMGGSVTIAIDNCPHQVVLAERPRKSIAWSPGLAMGACSARNSPSPAPTTRRALPRSSSRWTSSTGTWSCIRPGSPSTRARRPDACPIRSRKSAASPSPSGRGRWPFARRSRRCTATGFGSSLTSAPGATSAATWRTSSAAVRRTPCPPTCREGPGPPSLTTWSRRSSPRGSRSTPPTSTPGADRRTSTSTLRPPERSSMGIEIGFPAMSLSQSVIARLARGDRPAFRPETRDLPQEYGHRGGSPPPSSAPPNDHPHHPRGDGDGHGHGNGHVPAASFRDLATIPVEPIAGVGLRDFVPATLPAVQFEGLCGADEEAMLGFLKTMNDFLRTQGEVVGAFSMPRAPPVP